MPMDELSRGLEFFRKLCGEAGLALFPPQQFSFEREPIPLAVGKAVSWQGANVPRTFTIALNHNFLSDLPSTPKYPEHLNKYLQGLSSRFKNPSESDFMSLSGIPVSVDIEWPLRNSPGGRDALFVASEWVKKELAEAMQREIAEKRVVVLPILHRECQRPPFLTDKKYADFTKNYEDGLHELLRGFDR